MSQGHLRLAGILDLADAKEGAPRSRRLHVGAGAGRSSSPETRAPQRARSRQCLVARLHGATAWADFSNATSTSMGTESKPVPDPPEPNGVTMNSKKNSPRPCRIAEKKNPAASLPLRLAAGSRATIPMASSLQARSDIVATSLRGESSPLCFFDPSAVEKLQGLQSLSVAMASSRQSTQSLSPDSAWSCIYPMSFAATALAGSCRTHPSMSPPSARNLTYSRIFSLQGSGAA
jgi:hypothetical protein